MKKISLKIFVFLGLSSFLIACNDLLDKEPLSSISPENYFTEESHLAAYTINLYPSILPSTNLYRDDMHSDIMAYMDYNNRYIPGEWRVAQSGGEWNFSNIYKCNYFMEEVLPKWKNMELTGSNIEHYIGEMYFLRAYEYFSKLMVIGDFPILRKTYPDDMETLKSITKRDPRNEVARFIISDLDSAIMLLSENAPGGSVRISKDCASLFKSRVALYEGTWLKYFKGTAFVPNGTNWLGKDKEYNSNYSFPSGNIDNEINYFLEAAMEAAKDVADKRSLTENNQTFQQLASDPVNPYFNMFGDVDMSGYNEILLWREFNRGYEVTHSKAYMLTSSSNGVGLTRGLIDGFLMKNGLPVYATNSGYHGDDYISDVKKERDNRLVLFLKEPGQKNALYNVGNTTGELYWWTEEDVPRITHGTSGYNYPTGYASMKGLNFDVVHGEGKNGGNNYTGIIIFRAAEAYLNYMEACYERYGSLNAYASQYWIKIRDRAGVDADYAKTIANTDMQQESLSDWGAYSGNVLVDETLYNIRRERRCELFAEGIRYMDLKRWRSMDQMINNPFHIEGFKLWGPMQEWYQDDDGNSILVYGANNSSSNVSSPDLSEYLRRYEIHGTSLAFDGYRWNMAHYLNPIAVNHFLITSEDNDVTTSPLYQNPYWPIEANSGPN